MARHKADEFPVDNCVDCGTYLIRRHLNAIRCVSCAAAKRSQPASNLTKAQAAKAARLAAAGKYTKAQIAEKVGVSEMRISRWRRETGTSLAIRAYSAQTIGDVLSYYEQHGRVATEKKFPKVKVRSIVERHDHEPRQIRWADGEIHLAAKMAGLIPFDRQAEILGRPNANAGSIRSLWAKRINLHSDLHGMRPWQADVVLREGYPYVQMPTSYRKTDQRRRLCLWCDAVNWIRPDMPKFIRVGIEAMAEFQAWLFAPANPRRAILALLAKN